MRPNTPPVRQFAGWASASARTKENRMSETKTLDQEVTEMFQPPAAKKTTRTRKVPAPKATAPKPAEKPAEKETTYTYVVRGRGGIENRRTFSSPRTVAIDVADPNATRPQAKAGLITRLYASEEKAAPYVESM